MMNLSSEKNCPDAQPPIAVPKPPRPDSAAWRIHRERVLLLGWGRAILLQFAHPLVAQGVAEHSVFVSHPAARVARLRSTINSMLALTFGDRAEAAQAVRRINSIHDTVHGELRSSTKAFARGTLYSARDAELLRWVHATLLDSFMLTYEQCVGVLSAEEKNAYCFDSAEIEPLLGIPTGYLPRSARELRLYMKQMLASGRIEVTDTARQLGNAVLYPDLSWPAHPLLSLMRLFTIGTLPSSVRAAYEFSWSIKREKLLIISTATIRRMLPLVPPILRYWKAARVAERRRLTCVQHQRIPDPLI